MVIIELKKNYRDRGILLRMRKIILYFLMSLVAVNDFAICEVCNVIERIKNFSAGIVALEVSQIAKCVTSVREYFFNERC